MRRTEDAHGCVGDAGAIGAVESYCTSTCEICQPGGSFIWKRQSIWFTSLHYYFQKPWWKQLNVNFILKNCGTLKQFALIMIIRNAKPLRLAWNSSAQTFTFVPWVIRSISFDFVSIYQSAFLLHRSRIVSGGSLITAQDLPVSNMFCRCLSLVLKPSPVSSRLNLSQPSLT